MKICGNQSQTMRTKYQRFVIKNCNKETGSGQWDSGCCRSFAVCRKIRLKGISIDKHFGQGKSPLLSTQGASAQRDGEGVSDWFVIFGILTVAVCQL